ncbi:MAG: asparagine synthase-related protein [Candidatus Bathyarchaeota archaeon]|nr:asparagine synthase-related protein [Candidatus Bathyarchaeota archaeon]
MNKKPKVLVLLSGGLDSTLAVKAMLNQDLDVEAVIFTTPFCLCDKCSAESVVEKFGIKAHAVFLGQEYLDLITNPPHGYGSQMNPCIDCRIMMMRKAKELAQKLGAKCVVTGEVLDERPFSQTKRAMQLIERKAGMEGKILRPLSAKLLPETEFEKSGQVNREKLHSIRGRRRLPQMDLAEKWGVKDYPCPSGGCLLTDPRFAERLKDLLKYKKDLRIDDINLLRIGRHFRFDGSKFIVGRNEEENHTLLMFSKGKKLPYLEVVDHMGPITLLEERCSDEVTKKAAEITIRYSDVENGVEVDVKRVLAGNVAIIRSTTASDEEINLLRV